MVRAPQNDSTTPETVTGFAEDTTVRTAPGAPTPADYQREHNTYRAVTDLVWTGTTVVAAGGSVPVSHPGLRDSNVYGPGWITQGAVVLTGAHDAPEDLAALHEAAQKRESVPGAGQFPGA